MGYIEYIEILRQQRATGATLINGVEKYLTDLLLTTVEEVYVKEEFSAFQMEIFREKTPPFDEIYRACETLPWPGDRRIVIVDGIDLSRSGVKANGEFLEKLLAYLPKMGDHVLLFLVVRGGKAFQGAFLRSFRKLGEVVDVLRLNNRELQNFIGKKIQREKKKITMENLSMIAQMTGYSEPNSTKTLYDVENEVDKIIDASGDVVTAEQISGAMTENWTADIFRFLDALSARQEGRAYEIFRDITKSGADLYQTFYMIVRQSRNLNQAKILGRSVSPKEGAKTLKISEFEYKKNRKFLDAFTQEELGSIHRFLYEQEVYMKTGAADMELLIQRIIARWCRRGK